MSRLAALLALSLLAAGCSEVREDRSSGDATAAGSGGGHSGAGAGAAAGSGGAAAGGGGSGGAAPADAPWQLTAAYQGGGTVLAVDPEGDVIVAGKFLGTLDLGGETLTSVGPGALFMTKVDSGGQLVWAKSFPDSLVDSVGIAVDGDGDAWITGGFRGAIDFGGGPLMSVGQRAVFVAKLDPAGNPLQAVSFGADDGAGGTAVTVDKAGNAYVAGTFSGTLAIGNDTLTAASTSTFVAELDPGGTPMWASAFGVGDNVEAANIAWSPDGSLAVTGSYNGVPDLGGGPLPATVPHSAFVLRLDGSGNYLDSDGYNCRSIGHAFDGAGQLYVGCAYSGYVDFGAGPMLSGYFLHIAVAKLAVLHHPLWVVPFGQEDTTVYDLGVSPAGAGGILLAGRASGDLDLGGGELLGGSTTGGFLGELDTSGKPLWSRGLGGSGDVQEITAAVAPGGDVFAAGMFDGTLDLATGPVTAPAATGLFLTKLVP